MNKSIKVNNIIIRILLYNDLSCLCWYILGKKETKIKPIINSNYSLLGITQKTKIYINFSYRSWCETMKHNKWMNRTKSIKRCKYLVTRYYTECNEHVNMNVWKYGIKIGTWKSRKSQKFIHYFLSIEWHEISNDFTRPTMQRCNKLLCRVNDTTKCI